MKVDGKELGWNPLNLTHKEAESIFGSYGWDWGREAKRCVLSFKDFEYSAEDMAYERVSGKAHELQSWDESEP